MTGEDGDRRADPPTREHPLYRLVGILDESDAERVRERVAEFRADVQR